MECNYELHNYHQLVSDASTVDGAVFTAIDFIKMMTGVEPEIDSLDIDGEYIMFGCMSPDITVNILFTHFDTHELFDLLMELDLNDYKTD